MVKYADAKYQIWKAKYKVICKYSTYEVVANLNNLRSAVYLRCRVLPLCCNNIPIFIYLFIYLGYLDSSVTTVQQYAQTMIHCLTSNKISYKNYYDNKILLCFVVKVLLN